ncbi:MAG: hypothetical protein Hals2KO_12740 [Halioglobus sp.]
MKRLLVYSFLTFAVLTALLVTLLLSLDLGRLRTVIEPLAEAALGREVVLAGPLHVDIGRTITIRAQDVSLTNPGWTQDPVFVEFASLELVVETASLFGGAIVIESLRVHDLDIDLESRSEGPANWELTTTENTAVDEATEESDGIPLLVKNMAIDDIRVEFSGPLVEAPVVLLVHSLAQSVNERAYLEMSLDATLNAAPVSVTLELGEISQLETLGQVAMTLSGNVGEIAVSGDARVQRLLTFDAPSGNLRLNGPSFRYLAQLLNLRTASDGPLALDISLAPGEAGHSLAFSGRLASITATATGTVPDMRSLEGLSIDADFKGNDFAGFETLLGLPPGEPGAFEARLKIEPRAQQLLGMQLSGQVAGTQLKLDGLVENAATGLGGSTFDFSVTTPSLDTSLAHFDIQSAPQTAMTGVAAIRVVDAGLVSADFTLSLGQNSLSGSGELVMTNAGWSLDAPFKVDLQSPHQLLPQAQETMELPAVLQGLKMHGVFKSDPEYTTVQRLTVAGNALALELDARWATTDPLAAPELKLKGRGTNLAAAIDGLPPALDTPFSLEGNVSRSGTEQVSVQLALSAEEVDTRLQALLETGKPDLVINATLTAGAAGSDVGGDISVTLADPPRAELRLQSKLLDLRPWIAMQEEDSSETEEAPGDGRLIPDIDFTGIALPALDATWVYRAQRVETGVEFIEDLEVYGSLADPTLIIDKLAFRGQGDGNINASLGMEARNNGLDVWIRLEGDNVSVGMPAQDPDEAALLPRYDVSLAYKGKGQTLRELAAEGDGFLRFASGAGKIDVGAMSIFTNDIMLELLNTVNPFASKDKYSNIECSVLLATLEGGVLLGEPLLVVQSDRLQILANAQIDLRTEEVEADFNTVPRKGLGIGLTNLIHPYVRIDGTLATPVLGVDSKSALVSGGATVATGGLSILAKSMWDRLSVDDKACEKTLADGQAKFDRLEQFFGSSEQGGARR